MKCKVTTRKPPGSEGTGTDATAGSKARTDTEEEN